MNYYSFINESITSNVKKFLNADAIGKKLTYIAAGGLAGNTIGGVVGFLYGVKVYESKEKTLNSMEEKIMDPTTSVYNRQRLIDAKNLIQSMSNDEYRNYVLKDYYQRGVAIGGTIGSMAGAGLSMMK